MDPAETSPGEQGTRERYCAEVRRSTRMTGIGAGAIALFAYPAWTLFDYLVEPEIADQLLPIRLAVTVAIAILVVMMLAGVGRRRPEPILLAITLVVNGGIVLMLTRVETNYAAYSLGMSLTVYTGAALLIWPPRYTIAMCAVTLAGIALAFALSDPIPADAIATVYFYFGTACLLSIVGQTYRERIAWREFQFRDALELEQARSSALVEELDRLSREDPLTGLANRRAWDEALARECARAARDGGDLSILLCDLDGLKTINDRLGHPVGDAALRTVGSLLRDHAREADLVARIGGDEFAVLSPGADLLGATELAERLRRLVDDAGTAAGLGEGTISVGVADWEGGDDTAETLMLRADRRLYRAKATRNVVCAGDPSRH